MKQLFGFQKVMLAPGGSADLFFAASAEAFMLVDKEVLGHYCCNLQCDDYLHLS